MDKVTGQVSTNHNLFEEKGEPKRVSNRGPPAYQPNALPLGQTGSQYSAPTGPLNAPTLISQPVELIHNDWETSV